MTCDRCYQDAAVGDHGLGLCPLEPRRTHAIVRDEIPGGQWIENLGHEPMLFHSQSAILKEADRRGLRLRNQWAGPHDKHLTNWAAGIDAQTLENARVLLSRRASPRAEASEPEQAPLIERYTRVVGSAP